MFPRGMLRKFNLWHKQNATSKITKILMINILKSSTKNFLCVASAMLVQPRRDAHNHRQPHSPRHFIIIIIIILRDLFGMHFDAVCDSRFPLCARRVYFHQMEQQQKISGKRKYYQSSARSQ